MTDNRNKYIFKNEAAIVLYKDSILDHSIGTPVRVEFNFEKIWEFKRQKKRRKFDPKKLHFVHVHPPNFLELSTLDINCIQGLSIAFEYPILFSIVCFDEKGKTTGIKSFRYDNGLIEAKPKLGGSSLLCLKLLSAKTNPNNSYD